MKPRAFNETVIGYHLQHAAPLEYSLILEASGACVPKPELIEAVAYASLNPFFRTAKFHTCLKMYRKFGLRPPKPVKLTARKELYYIKYRRGIAENFKESF